MLSEPSASNLFDAPSPESYSNEALDGAPNLIEERSGNVKIMKLDELCKTIIENKPDILACCVVNLKNGVILGVHNVSSNFFQPYLDVVAAMVVQLFRGNEIKQVESFLSSFQSREISNALEEIMMGMSGVYHFMKVIPNQDVAAVMVTKKSVNQAIGWLAIRNAIPLIEKALLK